MRKNQIWGSRRTSSKDKQLLEAIQELRCEFISTGKPSYWPTDPNKIPDLIDFVMIKNISINFLQINEIYELNLDHIPIVLTMSEHIIEKEKTPSLTKKFTDWESFKINLERKITLAVPIKNNQQIDYEANKLICDIQQSAWESIPIKKAKFKCNNYTEGIRARKK